MARAVSRFDGTELLPLAGLHRGRLYFVLVEVAPAIRVSRCAKKSRIAVTFQIVGRGF